MKKTISVLILSALATGALFAQKTATIATVNVQRVLNDYSEFQNAVEKVKGSVAPVEEEMQAMQQSMQELMAEGREAEAKAKNPALGEEARSEAQSRVEELQQELQSKQAKLQQFRQQAQQLAQQGQQQQLQPLQQKALEAVETVAEDKGIDLVVPTNNIVYGSDSLEITDAVIAVLNASAEGE